MSELAPFLRPQFFDDNGDPLSGGKLYSYIAGTSTPLSTYTDASGSTPNANPVVLDASGRAAIWIGSGSYKFLLATSADVTIWTEDNVTANNSDVDSGWAEHTITDGQAATDLSGETVNLVLYSSALYEVEVMRGSPVAYQSSGWIAVQVLAGTARVVAGAFISAEAHGVTFSVSQVATTAQLKAATSSGPGVGTIKLRRRLVPT